MKRAFLALAGLLASPAMAGPASIDGMWKNPRGTIEVRIAPCGSEICGAIAGASAEAQQDARNAGVAKLIGTELLQDYKQVAPDRWEGRIFVPDMGNSYPSHIVQVAPNQLKVSGCLIGGWLCKSQLWTRG